MPKNTTENGWEERFDEEFDNNRHVELSFSGKSQIKTFIQHIAKEEYERGRNGAIEELFTIEKEKWSDAIHCTCLGYALVELSGGEESKGGRAMEERLTKLAALETPNTETV